MSGVDHKSDVQESIDKVLARLEGSLDDKDLHKLVHNVIETLQKAQVTNGHVFERLAALSEYIANAKKEIATIRADAINGAYIPSATDQLDAVVGATEDATNKIMDCCDRITTIAGAQAPDVQTALMDEVTKVYEACNFQDITGQRITKVVRTLKHIEGQVDSLLKALEQAGFQIEALGQAGDLNVSQATDTEKHLLNGPQMQNEAIKQDDIDKLFS